MTDKTKIRPLAEGGQRVTSTMIVAHDIRLDISNLPDSVMELIKGDLTLRNPAYDQAIKLGRTPRGVNEYIRSYRAEDDWMIMSRGYGRTLQKHLIEQGVKWQTIDKRLTLPRAEFVSGIKLRSYQAKAVDAILAGVQGGVQAPCGSGKTIILLESMARIGQPCLWITHTKELAEQVISRVTQLLDIEEGEVGRIFDGQCTVGPRLTVALVQSLAKIDLDSITDKFGCVMIDEAHRLASAQFFHPVGQFPAKYRIWASATPDRADGLTPMVYAAAGPILHQIDQSEVPTLIPAIEVVETDFKTDENEYVKAIGAMVHDEARNRLIVDTITANAKGHYSLVLSERKEHLQVLADMLRAELPDMRIEVLHASLSKRTRADVMQRAINREVDILLSTQLAREGLDLPHLDRLCIAAPKRAAGATEQEIGRIMRPSENKSDAVVFDFWDSSCWLVKSQFWARREVYRKIGAQIQMPNRKQRVAY